ncbi:adenylate-forming reductase 06235-like [Euphorbia lathyris]|uniref:adenylate-forming reductase 06235-like n=1 Tax=Euphorbia lathyris TaxID=212925 RepID=UPI0033144B12
MQSPVRFSSCRGVSFEIKPQIDHFALPPHTKLDQNSNTTRLRPLSIFQQTSFRIINSFVQRSISQPSSHFCDLHIAQDEEEENELETLEEGEISRKNTPQQPLNNKAAATARKHQSRSRLEIMLLDQGLFTVYKRLFLLCFSLNMIMLILAATGNFSYAKKKAALFSIANILALTLCRNELFLRLVFWLSVELFGRSWVPLRLKTTVISFLQSLGGIHSGCGVSSIAWLIYALVLTLQSRQNTSSAIIGVASTILSLLCWTALALVWVYILLSISYNPITKSYSDKFGSRLVRQQEFWLILATTILIITPWVTVRRVPVKVTAPSGHASIIKFQGGVKAGMLGRISPSPLSEWHAFGIISDGKDEHMMLAGAVGDYTKSLVSNPPSHLWVRKVHFAGAGYLANMFDRVLLVATGSGICVFLSFLLQPCKANLCMMSGHPKDKVIVHDTAILGRPNVSEMSVEIAKKWGAQVVFVTSNPEGSRDIVNACNAAGIPGFGPIWDS